MNASVKLAAFLCVSVLLAACKSGPPKPGQESFSQANTRLTAHGKLSAFGNGPVAKQLAEKFNLRMKLMLKLGFKNNTTGAAVDDEIITHVNLTDDKVIFLINIPELRKYKEDAQGTMLDIAWTLAKGRLEGLQPERERTLAVALRGFALYGAAAFGPSNAEQPQTKTHSGLVDLDQLYPYFTDAYPKDVELASEAEKPEPK